MQSEDITAAVKIREEFIELVGRISQAEGLPKSAGRMMGLLIFDGGQVSFGDMAERLHISRGSVSSSSRVLEEFGLIRRTSKPGQRQDYFELEEDPYLNLLDRACVRAKKAKDLIEKSASQLDESPEIKGRVADFADFYRTMEHCISRTRLEITQT